MLVGTGGGSGESTDCGETTSIRGMSDGTRGVAVIGSGPAGLAAAWALSGSRPVRLYESRPRPGGRLRTEEVAGARADAVVQLISDAYVETVGLLEAMGLRDRLVEVPGRDAVWRNGRPHGLRYGSVVSMAASGALPTGLKLRLGLRYVPFLERHGATLDLNDPASMAGSPLDSESIAEWGRRELGEDFVELMAYPLLAAYYGVTPEETSAAFFHALARAGQHVTVLGIRGGFGSLSEAMVAALERRGVEVRLDSPVDSVEERVGSVALRVAAEVVEHDAAVVAVPAPAAAALLPGRPWLRAIGTRSTATLVLSLDRRLDTGWFGLSIPRREPPGEVLAAVCVQSEKGTDLGGDGDALVLIPAPAVADSWARAEPGVVMEQAVPALDRVLSGASARIRGARLIRLPDQVTVPAPGLFDRSTGSAADPDSGRIAVAGDYRVGPTVEGAVRSGLAAATRLTPGGG